MTRSARHRRAAVPARTLPTVVDQTMTFMDYAHVAPAWAAALADDFAAAYQEQVDRLR